MASSYQSGETDNGRNQYRKFGHPKTTLHASDD